MTALTLVIGNQNYSSWSLRPWLAMKQAGLEFEVVRVPLYQSDTSAHLQRYGAAGKVPILLDGSLTIWDSLAILEHLQECFPKIPWLPSDPHARSLARSICAEMHSGFLKLRQHMPMNCRADLPGLGRVAGVQADIDRITQIWQTCRQSFGADGDFLFGAWSIADAMYAPVVCRFQTYGVDLDPVCQAYSQAVLALPAMHDWFAAAEREPETLSAFEVTPRS